MQYDSLKRQINLSPSERMRLGLGSDYPAWVPDTEVHDLIDRVAQADSALVERQQDEVSSDPLVVEGLRDDREVYLYLYGGFCAVRNTVEALGESDSVHVAAAFASLNMPSQTDNFAFG